MNKTNVNHECAFCDIAGRCLYSKNECDQLDGCCSNYTPRLRHRAKMSEDRVKTYEVSARGLKHPFFSERKWTGPEIYKTCTRKVRFRDESAAVANTRKHMRTDGKQRYIYLCPLCGGFHSSSKAYSTSIAV